MSLLEHEHRGWREHDGSVHCGYYRPITPQEPLKLQQKGHSSGSHNIMGTLSHHSSGTSQTTTERSQFKVTQHNGFIHSVPSHLRNLSNYNRKVTVQGQTTYTVPSHRRNLPNYNRKVTVQGHVIGEERLSRFYFRFVKIQYLLYIVTCLLPATFKSIQKHETVLLRDRKRRTARAPRIFGPWLGGPQTLTKGAPDLDQGAPDLDLDQGAPGPWPGPGGPPGPWLGGPPRPWPAPPPQTLTRTLTGGGALWTDRNTENITFPQTSFAGGNKPWRTFDM